MHWYGEEFGPAEAVEGHVGSFVWKIGSKRWKEKSREEEREGKFSVDADWRAVAADFHDAGEEARDVCEVDGGENGGCLGSCHEQNDRNSFH